jgi:hypothetical protein
VVVLANPPYWFACIVKPTPFVLVALKPQQSGTDAQALNSKAHVATTVGQKRVMGGHPTQRAETVQVPL